ncbi:hypothetical protein ACED51_16835 [Photobacterium swingsii]
MLKITINVDVEIGVKNVLELIKSTTQLVSTTAIELITRAYDNYK